MKKVLLKTVSLSDVIKMMVWAEILLQGFNACFPRWLFAVEHIKQNVIEDKLLAPLRNLKCVSKMSQFPKRAADFQQSIIRYMFSFESINYFYLYTTTELFQKTKRPGWLLLAT